MYLWQLPVDAQLAYSISTGETSLNLLSRPSPNEKTRTNVLRMKEQELLRVRKEMDALRIAARLLGTEDFGRCQRPRSTQAATGRRNAVEYQLPRLTRGGRKPKPSAFVFAYVARSFPSAYN